MLRSMLAIIFGFVLWTILWLGSNQVSIAIAPGAINADGSANQSGILWFFLLLSVLFSIASGYVTTAVARTDGFVPALVLGIMLLAVGIFVQSGYWNVMPIWYHLLFLGLLAPSALVGWWIKSLPARN